MALTRQQYDSLMQSYAYTRDQHRRELSRRRDYVYAKIPDFRRLDEEIYTLGGQELKKQLAGAGAGSAAEDGTGSTASGAERPDSEGSFAARIASVSRRKRELLRSVSLPEDYLDPIYTCPDCRDTGYIDGQKCHCLKAAQIRILYDQSHLKELVRDNNFDSLSESWYEGEDLSKFRKAVLNCRSFINNFDSGYENLYFYGTVGTGKSFLSISTAQEVLRTGHSVLYFSASGLFETISSYLFDYKNRDDYRQFTGDLYDCDLLVIDDLGTEMMSSLVSSQLFTCINERHILGRSTIISSNLSLEELQQRYSERVYSRIISSYTMCKLTGPDIRVLKKVRNRNPWNH